MSTYINPDLVERVINLAETIQGIPAPSLDEGERSIFIKSQFEGVGLSNVLVDGIGNVYGRLSGAGGACPLVISAHLDTVFSRGTDLSGRRDGDKIYGPGIGDNSLGVAGLIGLFWALCQRDSSRGRSGDAPDMLPCLPGDIWLVANVGEEGLGDLMGMRTVVDRFSKDALAYIVLEGLALGQVYNRGLGVRRYRISSHTVGGHSWVDFGQPSAINELAALIMRLTGLETPERPRTTFNVGVISGGISVNTIAPQAHMELDLRSEGAGELKELARRIEGLVREGNQPGIQFTYEVIGDRPTGEIPAAHPLVELAMHSLRSQGIQPHLNIGSTDANVPLSRGFPAVCVGLSTGHGAHTVDEYIDAAPLALGLAQLVDLVEGAFEIYVSS
ncbi:MAG: M20/M25/M40 family metallo-hydrolase [Deltaproteobacteria bacterium]|nr:M20/M25/M40 family metallo-hydrolase [Deltaproteobacteria bacterium]